MVNTAMCVRTVYVVDLANSLIFYSMQSATIANKQQSLISYSINHLPPSLGFYVTIL